MKSGLADAAATGVKAFRRFHRPFLLIQFVSVALVVVYYTSDGARSLCATLAAWRVTGGLPFAAIAAAVAGGVVPELARMVADRGHGVAGATVANRRGEVLFNVAFFAFNGAIVDLLYRGEARLFGTEADVGTIIKKAAFDQFVFNPVWLPVVVPLFFWRKSGFNATATLRMLRGPRFYRTHVLPLLLPSWCFWVPMVVIIYALPLPLQFLLFVLALAAWSLIMLFIAGGEGHADATPVAVGIVQSTP